MMRRGTFGIRKASGNQARLLESALQKERTKSQTLERLIAVKTKELYLEKQELNHLSGYLRGVLETMGDALLVCSPDRHIMLVNVAAERLTGIPREDLLGERLDSLIPQLSNSCGNEQVSGNSQGLCRVETILHAARDARIPVAASFAPMRDASGAYSGDVCVLHDLSMRRALELRLLQAQKLESVGTLAAGIAHEINTPIQYVGDNNQFLADAFRAYQGLVSEASRTFEQLGVDASAWRELCKLSDVDFLQSEVSRAIDQTIEGVKRVAAIVRAMKEFAHPDKSEKEEVDLNRAIESTVMVSRNEWKYVAEVEFDLDPQLPAVPLHAGEFNQAILNLLVNAAHAIGERFGPVHQKGVIRISTRKVGDWVSVAVSDNGTGIPDKVRAKIFDHFFTTKEVGKGSGQGLSLVQNVIERRHGGSVTFESTEGQGTTFILKVPCAVVSSVALS